MKKSWLLLNLVIFILVSCKHSTSSVNDDALAVPVKCAKIENQNIKSTIALSGNVEGEKSVRLGFLVAGKVTNIRVVEGEVVSKGTLIASLDPESYELAKSMADANLNQVQDDYNRLSKMHETNSVTERDYSKISNGYVHATSNQKLQDKNLRETQIYAPFDGVILKKGVEIGEIVGSGMPLFVISSINKVKVNAALPEKELQRVKVGDMANIYVAALDSTVNGKIIEIGAVAEPTTRSFSIKIEIENSGRLLRPGMIAEIQIASAETKSKLLIPIEAILHDVDNQPYIFVIDPLLNKSFKRKVRLGALVDNKLEATSGVKSGELVVVAGHQKLNDGTTVILK